MNQKDREQLKKLQKLAKIAAEALRGSEIAEDIQISNDLLFSVGYAVGLAHRLEKERQAAEDHIAGCLT